MSDAWRVASIQSFEQVPVSPATALLRVTAVSTLPVSGTDARPVLVVDDGHERTRVESLPAPPDEGSVLRCAFSVPAARLVSTAAFSLQFADGFVIALSRPTPAGRRPRPASADPATLAAPASTLPATANDAPPGERARTLRLHLEAIEARAELRALRDLTALSPAPIPSEIDERVRALEHERDVAVAEAAAATARLDELEVWSAELERRLADTTTALADTRADDGQALEALRREAVERAHRVAEHDLAELSA